MRTIMTELFQAIIIYSEKEILPDEPFKENPVAFNQNYDRTKNPDIGSHLYLPNSKPYIDSFADARRIKEQHGSVYFCPSNCYCRDPEIDKIVKESKSIYQLIESKQVAFNYKFLPNSFFHAKRFTFIFSRKKATAVLKKLKLT